MSFIRNTLHTFISNSLVILLSVANSILVARLLGPEGRGNFAIYQASVNLLMIWLGLGLPSSTVFFISKHKHLAGKVFLALSFFYLLVNGIFFSIYYHIGDDIKVRFIPGGIVKGSGVAALAISVYAFQMITILISIYSAFLDFPKANLTRLLLPALMLAGFSVFTFPFLYAYVGVELFMWINTGAYALTFLYMMLPLFSLFRTQNTQTHDLSGIINFAWVRQFFLWGGMAYLANAAQFLNYRLDYWFVEYFRGPAELGYYSVASGLAQMLWVVPSSISGVLFPYVAQESTTEKHHKTAALARIVFVLCTGMGVAGYLLADYIIPWVYGVSFAPSSSLFKLLLAGVIPFCVNNVLAGYLAGANLVKINLMGSVLGLGITILLDLLLIPLYGTTGAAIATVCSYTITTLFVALYFAFKFHIPLSYLFILRKEDVANIRHLFKKI